MHGPGGLSLLLCLIYAFAVTSGQHQQTIGNGAEWANQILKSVGVVQHSSQGVARRASQSHPISEATATEACITTSFLRVAQSCFAYASEGPSASKAVARDRLVKLVLRCLSNDTNTPQAARNQPMRMLLTTSVFASLIKNMTQVYTQLTDVPIRVDTPSIPTASTVRLQSIANAANYSATHESWMIGISGMGDGVASGAFKDITDLVSLDRRLGWEGLMPVLRTSGLLYKSQVFGMPLSANTYHLAYRKDVFEQYSLTVPRTWKELLDFAVTKNGTNGMHAFCGVWAPCFQLGTVLVRAMLASSHQTRGPKEGWLFDADSMELMLGGPAMTEAIDMIKGLYAASPPDDSVALGCPAYGYRFTGPTGGQCLMSIVHPYTFKYASHQSRINVSANLYGNLGIAPWPGSETVLDRATNTLVPCDSERCPYATRASNPDGSTLLINRSPGFEAQMMTLNAHTAPDVSFFTMSVLSYLSAPETSNALVFNPDAETYPTRTSQLDWRLWVAAGFNEHDARACCSDMLYALGHPNINFGLRIPGAPGMVSLFGQIVNNAYSGMATSKVVEAALVAGLAILNKTYNGNTTALKAEYWASINRALPPSLPPPSPPPQLAAVPPASPDEGGDGGHTISSRVLIICVAVPACALGVMAALAIRYRWLARLRPKGGRVRHPGMGPTTTLCVTDIEESTLLWESCDALVMDTSVKLHNGCVRNLAAKHAGYETVWEGDSFVIAFSHPSQAVAFCMAVQKELLLLPWPAALLQTNQAGEVWCVAASKQQANRSVRGGAKFLDDDNGSARGDSKYYATATSPTGIPAGYGSPPVSTATSPGPWLQNSSNSYRSITRESTPLATAMSQALPPSHSTTGRPDLDQASATTDATEALNQHRFHVKFTLPSSNDALGAGPANSPAVNEQQPARCKDMGAHWRAQWVACAPGTPQAVLAFCGLRVRLGMHVGIETAACVNYNSVMRRYHYTGPVRVISNAVASAGHGGYTLLSSSTASLLCSDSTGVLEGLPSDCNVFNLGSHELSNVEDNTELLLVLPNALQCRLGLQQTALRSLGIKVAGVLAAPIPMRCAADNSALVYIQFSGFNVLLAWNAKEATRALKCAAECLRLEVGEWRGVISEDGLEAIMAGRRTKTSSSLDQVVPGRMVMAFNTWHAAVAFALSSRHQLLMLDWSEQLLSHELCERIGQNGADENGSWGAAVMYRTDSELVRLADGDDRAESEVLSSPRTPLHTHSFIGNETPRSVTPSYFGHPGQRVAAQSCTGNETHRFVGSAVDSSTALGSVRDRAAAPVADSSSSESGSNHRAAAPFYRMSFLQTPRGNTQTSTASRVPSMSSKLLAAVRNRTTGTNREDIKATTQRAAKKYITLEAPLLRGLRIRTVVVPGKGAEFAIAMRSSGRCVYSGGPAKVAARLLNKVHVGQVMVESKLLQAALHSMA